VTHIHDTAHTDISTYVFPPNTPNEVPSGSIVHDTANTGGQVAGFGDNGAISFTFFTTASCTGTGAAQTNTNPAEATFAASTVPTSALVGGQYSYLATIAASANYNSASAACEPFTVLPIMPLRKHAVQGTIGAGDTFTFGLFLGPSSTVAGVTTPNGYASGS